MTNAGPSARASAAVSIVAAALCACAAQLWASVVCAQHEAATEPPRLISLPEIDVPQQVPLPAAGRVEVVIRVESDGQVTVEVCEADVAICSAVGTALAAAHFEPARRAGAPVAARVRIALQVMRHASVETGASAAGAGETGAIAQPAAALVQPTAAPSPPAAAALAAAEEPLAFGARARTHPPRPGSIRLELAEMRDLPGAFGDPFRAVDALPGVVPVLSGLPYFYVRGSPPAGTLYVYDEIPMPTLYHLGVGPAVIHPRMVGPITLYSGVAPARYGRLTGGVITGEGPEAPDGRTHLEAELRLLDVSAYGQTNALGGTITGAVRYGYPALLLSVFSPRVSLAYWDYQLRYAADLSERLRLELVALGSYDSFGVADRPSAQTRITFHRIEPRLSQRFGSNEFGAALLLGWEESALGSQFQLQATRIAPRLWLQHDFGRRNRLRVSADMQGISGNFQSVVSEFGRDPSEFGLIGNVHARSLWGVQAELGLRPWTALELQFGVRGDAWVQSGGTQAVLDPRLRVIVHASDALSFHVAAGVVHQPAVFYVPLPGIADLANDSGLQTALQSEAGVGWDAPLGLRAELQGFVHRYDNLVFTDTLLLRNTLRAICREIDCMGASIATRINGLSYGGELFLRRPITEQFSGFVSYTLAFSQVDRIAGQPYTPSWDVRHVANVVLQWRIAAGFSAGLRWFLRSPKTTGDFLLGGGNTLVREEHQMPWFTRLDLELAYAWPTSWGRLRVALEWFNATLSKEPIDVRCAGRPLSCQTTYLPPIFFPNLSVRGEH